MSDKDDGKVGGAHRDGRTRHVLAGILIALAAALIAACLVLAVQLRGSIERIEAQAAVASEAGTELGDGISQLLGALSGSGEAMPDTGALVSQADTLDGAVASIQDELAGSIWGLVARLPSVGSDVSLARDLVDDARDLTQALPPAMGEIDQLASDNAFSDGGLPTLGGLRSDLETTRELIGSIEGVRDAAKDAQGKIESLGEPATPQLADAKSRILEVLGEVNAAFDEHADALDAVEWLGA